VPQRPPRAVGTAYRPPTVGERLAVALGDERWPTELRALETAIVDCRRCPRLVAWRERVAVEKRAAFRTWQYWGRPVPGFGDPEARLLLVGLAPAAHGGNRTGRIFTGDRSGDFLFAALHRAGLANQPQSLAPGDGLELSGCFITAAVRCAPPANKPTPAERDTCLDWLCRELAQLQSLRTVVALGSFAWDAVLRADARLAGSTTKPKPRFGHAAEATLASGRLLIGCYHPSQQNVFTGRLTEEMIDRVLARAVESAGLR